MRSMVIALSLISAVLGYTGSLLSQTMTFVGGSFDADAGQQGIVLAFARLDFILAMLIVVMADRSGRRSMLLWSVVIASVATALSGLASAMWMFAFMQIISHGAVGAAIVIVAVLAIEGVPKNSRAYVTGVLAIAAGVGAGACTLTLVLADLSTDAWRYLYLAGIVCIFFVGPVAKYLPESKRFEHRNVSVSFKGHWQRLLLLLSGGFLVTIFDTPAMGLRNDWLRHYRDFSGAELTLYNVVSYAPAGAGYLIGGILADRTGRRKVAAIGIIVGVVATLISYQSHGWMLWFTSAIAGFCAGFIAPAISVFGPELFPTALRARANGFISIARRGGAVVGLVAAPILFGSAARLGDALLVMAIGPAILALTILLFYPETAHHSLEEINPEDEDEKEKQDLQPTLGNG